MLYRGIANNLEVVLREARFCEEPFLWEIVIAPGSATVEEVLTNPFTNGGEQVVRPVALGTQASRETIPDTCKDSHLLCCQCNNVEIIGITTDD